MSEKNNTSNTPQGRRGFGFGGPHGGMMSGAKAKDFKGTLKRLARILKEDQGKIVLVILFAIGSATFGIVGPKLLGNATTKIFDGILSQVSGTGSGIDFQAIGRILLFLVVLYAVSALLSYIQGFIMTGVAMKISYRMRQEISRKINKIPLKYFDDTTHGEVLSRITNDVDTISTTLNQSMTQIITSVTTVFGVLVMMLSISGLMTLVALAMIPLSMGLVLLIVKQSQKYFKEQQTQLGHVNGHIEEMFGGHTIIKAFNGEEKSIEQFEVFNGALYQSSWKSQFLSSIMMPMINIVGNLGYVAVCVLGGSLAAKQAIEVGDIQAFIQYVRSFTQPMAQLANISNVLQQTAAAAERVFEFLDESEEPEDIPNPVDPSTIEGFVTFQNVDFGYIDDQKIIHDFSVHIQKGQKVAIVGPTGAGKTTIVKLLMRFYDLQGGAILLDGMNIRDFRRTDLRDQFGMVLQDAWLYNGTILENIRYGNLKASDDEVFAASKAAHVDSFVCTLPGGYDLVLNEEASNVSQGQKQLITIARAFLSDPKVLILDEATSSVDTRTEVQIQQAMVRLMENRTSFIIAHRLSTIRDADLILVMDHGDIVEQGTHLELLARKGFYADLYNSQFETQDTA